MSLIEGAAVPALTGSMAHFVRHGTEYKEQYIQQQLKKPTLNEQLTVRADIADSLARMEKLPAHYPSRSGTSLATTWRTTGAETTVLLDPATSCTTHDYMSAAGTTRSTPSRLESPPITWSTWRKDVEHKDAEERRKYKGQQSKGEEMALSWGHYSGVHRP